ncbi:hypothetical protein [Gordonia sp. (in: high G+C Gram-positive bacteria)]|uniref:hypothetical protein n=1 Tax=Gordonia sp. (in: high G+C Gram-positive bacteria) TaxID=84139 RepID=UPI00169DD94D|nr:hypothetical protein [Gordonia sp. (in: high G+C Gram-positive bacteria)]NLG45918.1 hypothetical protein [Gordonia sp. (in: high G+C Gram-positive bacteria)]
MSTTGDPALMAKLLTSTRLRSYVDATRGDLPAALRLYDWNTVVSAAVLATVAMVEVIVRNSMDTQLTRWASARGERSWLDALPLEPRGVDDLDRAQRAVEARGVCVDYHDHVVAELNLGFWRYLAAQRYLTSLWVPALGKAFPHGYRDVRERRRAVERHLTSLAIVRNRVAHHEPVHRRDLCGDLRAGVELATWVHPEAGAWVASRSPLEAVIARRPHC